MATIGYQRWAIAGGHVPLESTGHEPRDTSFDQLCLLNATDREADVALTLYYADREPVGPYPLRVAARRVRHVRLNDLINPEAMPLDTDYACVIESSEPIVVQFQRQDTSGGTRAIFSTPAFPIG